MFKGLRERLNIFKKRAKEEMVKEPAETVEAVVEPPRRESKFMRKARLREEKKRKMEKKGAPSTPAVTVSSRNAAGPGEMGGLTGDELLRNGTPIVESSKGFLARKLTEKKLKESLLELEMALLESDVAQPVVERIKEYIIEELTDARVDRKTDLDKLIEGALRNAIFRVLATRSFDLDGFLANTKRPIVIMFVGVNGTGKTTAIGRVAHLLKKKHLSCVLAAGDTFRAGAIEQLTKHAERLGLRIIKNTAGSDPAAVAYDAVEHAKARMKDVVLLDTAGRMQTNINLMDEMKKIRRVANPDLVVFVGDALAGNDAVIQARMFDEAVGIDGVILTKIDADAKGGAALSIAYTIGKPILFIGTGQNYEDLIPFDPKWMTDRLFEE